MQYCVYLDSVTHHYSTNKTVMAYVVFAEPSWKWNNPHLNDKIMVSNWSRKWYYLIKKNAPNQLVTLGLDGIENVLFWDPSALTYDFLTMHFYYGVSDPNTSKMAIHSYFRWMNDNIEDVWALGETGFSGIDDTCQMDPRVGSEIAQHQYAEYTMSKALPCGCKGYSWWQYQDVMWLDCLQDHLGIFTRYPYPREKSVASIFPLYPLQPQYMVCDRPDCYYNLPGYNHANISGVVLDQNKNPIKDAYVAAWSNSYKTYYSTFTDIQGQYTIYTPDDTAVSEVRISHKGYSSENFFAKQTTPDTTVLIHLNYNKWKKNWTNHYYPIHSDNFVIGSSDTVVVGNFCGDEAQELLVVKRSAGTASLHRFHTNHWEQVWNGSINNWQIGSVNKFYAGDYNGDGYDELMCVQVTNGTSDNMRLMQYDNSWSSLWNCNGLNDGGGIYPYRANLHVGNFDADLADEILGVGTWATKFDFNTNNQWVWSWSTYESGKLSDWTVNPNHRVFFQKVMTDVPDYLFVPRTADNHYLFDAYSFNP